MVNNGNGTYTFTNEGGVQTVIDVNEIDMDINSVTIAGSILTFTAEDGTVVNADVCALVAANCNATLVVNADGSLTHTANDGTVTNVAAPTVSTLVQDDSTGIITHTNGDAIVSTADVTSADA